MGRKSSSIWNYFTVSDRDTGIAKCNICEREFSFKTSISNLKKHLSRSNHALHLNLDTGTGESQTAAVEFIELDGLPDEMNDSEAEKEEQPNRCQLVIEEGVIPQGQNQIDDILDISNNTFNALPLPGSIGVKEFASVNLDLRQAFQSSMEDGLGNISESDFSGEIAEASDIISPDVISPVVNSQKEFSRTTSSRFASLRPQRKSLSSKLGNSGTSNGVSAADSSSDNEFELFGRHVGNQLRRLTKVNSFLAQDEIQSILTRYRIYESMSESNRRSVLNAEK